MGVPKTVTVLPGSELKRASNMLTEIEGTKSEKPDLFGFNKSMLLLGNMVSHTHNSSGE